MTVTVYPANLFLMRRVIRMHAHAGPVTTHLAERLALRSVKQGHSVASALSAATCYLRNVRIVAPKDCA